MRLRTAALLVPFVLAAACAGDDGNPSVAPPSASSPTATATANAVTVKAVDHAYAVEGEVKAGLTRITFDNTGKDFHMLGMVKLKDGKTAADLLAALKTEDEKDDDAVLVDPDSSVDGNPSVLTPGARTTTYADLQAGTYGLVCFFPGKEDGQPHFLKGMVNVLNVATGPSGASAPATTGSVTTTDTKLTAPDFSSGKGTYEYTNTGKETHALAFVRLHDGKTFAEMSTWLDQYFEGKAKLDARPGDVWGGLEATAKKAYFELDLPPGRYVAIDSESKGGEEGKEFYRDEFGGLLVEFTVG